MSGLVVLRFALAVVFDALAFTIWDVGTRPPLRLMHDVADGVRKPASVARGTVRLLVGFALLALAAIVARPAIPTMRAFTVLETAMLLAALLVEALIGPDLRARRRPRSAASRPD